MSGSTKERVLSGMRPSGRLHLGNYLGALANWVTLQDDYDCFYFSADWHVLTDRSDISDVPSNTLEMAADWLGAGLDPERSTLFIQSMIPEHAELYLLFAMVTPVGWLERVPTYKERIEQQGIASPSYGLLGYPLLQSADILMYKAKWVPVGIDQAPHVELTREVARRFNNAFKPVFPEPDVKLTEIPKVPGTDGRKMSKSYGNDIELADSPEIIRAKVRPMVTDPARKRRSDPGNPDICPVFDLHKIFTPAADREACAIGCRTAGIGCLDCKDVLLKHMVPPLQAIRERRQKYAEKPETIKEIFTEGSRRARVVAQQTMAQVREAVKLLSMTEPTLTPESAASELRLRVGDFEGPLDLLLHLCRTHEIDLAALPVRTITDQYLAHLEAIEFRDLETAGAYLVMAATLIYLKSKLLVPPDENAEEEIDEEALALKQELEERLREYARVKTQGAWLGRREAEQALIWGRPSATLPALEDVPLEDLSVHWLERALKRLIDEQQRARPREVEANPPSILERMTEILTLLRDTWSLLFSSMVGGERKRSEVVVTLLAVLELCRQGKIRTQQTDLFGDIVIERQTVVAGESEGGASPPVQQEG